MNTDPIAAPVDPESTARAHPQGLPEVRQAGANLPPKSGHVGRDSVLRRQAVLLTAACLAALVLCIVLRASARSAAAEAAAHQVRAAALAADAQAIAGLRERPLQATETGLPVADLLEQVARAMRSAQLDPQTLVSTLPEPPRRLPHSEHAEVAHRLMFEAVPLEAVVRFCWTLTHEQPELRIASLQLRAGQVPGTWHADVSVAYWILAPQGKPGAGVATGPSD